MYIVYTHKNVGLSRARNRLYKHVDFQHQCDNLITGVWSVRVTGNHSHYGYSEHNHVLQDMPISPITAINTRILVYMYVLHNCTSPIIAINTRMLGIHV